MHKTTQRRWVLSAVGISIVAGAWLWLGAVEPRPARQASTPTPTEPPAAAPPLTVVRAAAAAAPTAKPEPASAGEVVVAAPWGGAKDQLGRRVVNESSPEGPMSFAVGKGGKAYVLDQVNARVSVFADGQPVSTVSLPADTFQDIALRDDGGMALLDRYGAESVAFVDAKGELTHEIGLAGTGVPSAGDVTALFQSKDGTWVEVQHASLVRIADAQGDAVAERSIAAGRLAADGSALRLSKSGAQAAWVAVTPPGQRAEALARVQFDLPVLSLLALEPTADGRIVVAADLALESDSPPFDLIDARETVVVLSRAGQELQRFELPATSLAEESLRRIRVGDDGSIYHMGFSDSGVTVRRLL